VVLFAQSGKNYIPEIGNQPEKISLFCAGPATKESFLCRPYWRSHPDGRLLPEPIQMFSMRYTNYQLGDKLLNPAFAAGTLLVVPPSATE
jgi:hypothetical protein